MFNIVVVVLLLLEIKVKLTNYLVCRYLFEVSPNTGTVKKVARYSLTLMGMARRKMVPKNKALTEKTPNLYSIKLMI